jgi:hypothetical protein
MRFFTKQQLISKSNEVRRHMFTTKSAATILNEQANAADYRTFDIFLSHSYQDAELIHGLMKELEAMGYSVYVDWIIDRQLSRSSVSARTAEVLRRRMRNCRALFFATSDNSSDSKWMPWELGFFDGIRGKVAVLPILDTEYASGYEGQEYLGLYPYVAKSSYPTWRHDNLVIVKKDGTEQQFKEWLG